MGKGDTPFHSGSAERIYPSGHVNPNTMSGFPDLAVDEPVSSDEALKLFAESFGRIAEADEEGSEDENSEENPWKAPFLPGTLELHIGA